MAIELATGYVSVTPSAKGFEKKLRDETDDASRRAGDSAGEAFGGAFGGSLKKLAVIASAAFAGLKVGEFLKGSVEAASDLNETISKSNAIFGENAGEIEAWASTAATSLGQSKTQALGAAAQFGNMFDQLGIGGKQAATMSKQMVELASDFASFHNADITEVLEAQTAAFRGEYDSVQKFVPTINAASVEQKALALGLKGTTKELTAQDKAIATQALLMEGAGKAVGDFAKTSSGLANQQRIMAAQFDNLKATIGNAFLPVLAAGGNVLTTTVMPALQRFAETSLPAATKALLDFRQDGVDAVKAFKDGFTQGLDLAGPFDNLGRLLRNAVEAAEAFADGFKRGIDIPGDPFDNIGRAVRNIVESLRSIPGAISEFLATLKTGLTENDVATPLENIALKIRAVVDFVKENKDVLVPLAASAAAGAGSLLAYAGAVSAITVALDGLAKVKATLAAGGFLANVLGPIGPLIAAAGPIGILVAVIAALIAGIVLLYLKWQPFRDLVDDTARTIRDVAITAFEALKVAFFAVAGAAQTAWNTVTAVVSGAAAAVIAALTPIVQWITTHLFPTFAAIAVFVYEAMNRVYQNVSAVVELILQVLRPFAEQAYHIVSAAFILIRGAVEQTMNQIRTVITVAVNVLRPISETGFQVLLVVVQTVFDLIRNAIEVTLNTIRGIFSAATAFIRGDWSGLWNALYGIAAGILGGIHGAISGALHGIASLFGAILGGVPGIVAGIASGIRSAFSGIVSALQSAASTIEGLASRVRDAIASIPGAGAISGLLSRIPGLAAGGIVTRPTLAVVGEAGPEAVIPLEMFNQGVKFGQYPTFPAVAEMPATTGTTSASPTINIQAQTNADPYQVARELSWVLLTRGR